MKKCGICRKEISEEREICDECREKSKKEELELEKLEEENNKLTKMLKIMITMFGIFTIIISISLSWDSNDDCSTALAIMDTQDVQAFNSKWTNYEGIQTESQVKSMIIQMIGHANTYQDEPGKVITIKFLGSELDNGLNVDYTYIESDIGNTIADSATGTIQDYIKMLNDLYTNIRPKQKYNVSFNFAGESIIRQIILEPVD